MLYVLSALIVRFLDLYQKSSPDKYSSAYYLKTKNVTFHTINSKI